MLLCVLVLSRVVMYDRYVGGVVGCAGVVVSGIYDVSGVVGGCIGDVDVGGVGGVCGAAGVGDVADIGVDVECASGRGVGVDVAGSGYGVGGVAVDAG